LVTSARLRDAVLRPLIDTDEELAALAELEGATSSRLLAQHTGRSGIAKEELVYGVPQAAFINASFTYAKPRELSRFSGPDRGAWYAALELDVAFSEVIFHMENFLDASGSYHAVVEYAELFASFAGEFVDLRNIDPKPPCLDPDMAVGYPAGNALADQARHGGLNGIIYPSVRHPGGGICVVALWPHAVQSVAQGAVYRLSWTGKPGPTRESIS
jgi:hypothetical protein